MDPLGIIILMPWKSRKTNILKIVPDGIVDEANHRIYHGLFQKTLYLTVFGPPGDGFIVYRDQS